MEMPWVHPDLATSVPGQEQNIRWLGCVSQAISKTDWIEFEELLEFGLRLDLTLGPNIWIEAMRDQAARCPWQQQERFVRFIRQHELHLAPGPPQPPVRPRLIYPPQRWCN